MKAGDEVIVKTIENGNKSRICPWRFFVGSAIYLYIIYFSMAAFVFPVHAVMPAGITDQQSYIAWLEAAGKPAYSRYHGYAANYVIYRDYKLLSYGIPQIVPGNRYDSATGQYAMHGFSYDEYTLTNTYFRDDSAVPANPAKWKNISLGQDSAVSWMRLTEREKEHIKASALFYSDRDYGGMTYSSLRLEESQCIVLAVPSWNLGFALHTKHYNSRNELRYGTLHGNGIGGIKLSGTIMPASEPVYHTFTIPPDQEYIDLTFSVQSSVTAYTGLARSRDIARGGIVLNHTESETSGAGPWSTSRVMRFSRVSSVTDKDYRRDITVNATIWAVSASGDLVSKEIAYTFTLVEKAKNNLEGIMTISGAISLFNDEKTVMGYRLSRNSKRFLCLEKITLRIDFTGTPIPDYVVFQPVGSRDVAVNVTKTADAAGFAQIIYPMGILPSTINWDNKRLCPPYKCYASAYSGNNRTDYSLNGIEITGDVYDLVYLESMPAIRNKKDKVEKLTK